MTARFSRSRTARGGLGNSPHSVFRLLWESNWTYRLLWAVLIIAYIAIPLPHLNDYAWDYDEGPQIQAAALAHSGYPLYSEVALNKPPLLTWLLQLALRLGGTTLSTMRLAVLSMTTVGFLALGLLAEQWWGRWAGPAAMMMFLALPEVPARATVAMNDLPAMSTVLLALIASTLFRHTDRRPWLTASAVAYAAMLGLHPFLCPLIVPIALILLARRPEEPDYRPRTGWHHLAYMGFVVASLVLLGTLMVDQRGLVHWVLKYNTTPAVYELPEPDETLWDLIVQYMSCHWSLLGIAIVGGIMLFLETKGRLWVTVAATWFLVTLVTLILWQVPRDHYLLFLSYPLTITAGGGVAAAIRWIAEKRIVIHQGGWRRGGLPVLILVGVLFFAKERVKTSPEWSRWSADQQAARAFLRQEVLPEEFIISDDQLLVFAAGHLVPPSLADTSYKRIETGLLQVEDVISEILQRQVRFVVFGSGRFTLVPSLKRWVRMFASQQHEFGSIRVFRVETPTSPPHPSDSSVGEVTYLRGYRLSQEGSLRAGETLTVTLYWENAVPVQDEFTVFVHLVDTAGNLVGQHDSPPHLGLYPTNHWPPEVVVSDPHPIPLSADLSSGAYRLLVGMYRWPSLERLPALLSNGNRWPDDRIPLTELHLIAEHHE